MTSFKQDKSADMSPEQLQIFWSEFKVLDEERKHFHKPPTNWRPKECRDMNEKELQIYWAAFRKILTHAADKIPDTNATDTCPSSPSSSEVASSDCDAEVTSSRDMSEQQQVGSTDSLEHQIVAEASGSRDVPEQQLVSSMDVPEHQIAPKVRLRQKTPASQVESLSLERIKLMRKNSLHSKKRCHPPGSDPPAKKRKYQIKSNAARAGNKRPCVPIWTKVELFKDTLPKSCQVVATES